MLVRQQSAWLKREDDPEEVLLEVVIRPRSPADIWPFFFANAKLYDELLRQ